MFTTEKRGNTLYVTSVAPASSSQGLQSTPPGRLMAFQKKMPLDIMRYILTFKDPTNEVGVPGGIKAPSCVWYTWDQRLSAPRGAIILKYSQKRELVEVLYKEYRWGDLLRAKRFLLLKTRSRYWLRSDDDRDSDADKTCPTRLIEMSLQCAPCGPDLELYNIIRG